jgi:transcriptional regulator with XRE-family HTH domain
MNYGGYLKTRLKKLGRKQNELAQAIHFSPSYISKLLSGSITTTPEAKEAIDRQLDLWEQERKEARHGSRPER